MQQPLGLLILAVVYPTIFKDSTVASENTHKKVYRVWKMFSAKSFSKPGNLKYIIQIFLSRCRFPYFCEHKKLYTVMKQKKPIFGAIQS